MATLANSLSKAISTNLLNNLPAALAEEYSLEADSVKAFLSTFLSNQLPTSKGKGAAAARTPTPKGTNGKGRLTGYILFSNEKRAEVIADSSKEVFYKQKKIGKDDQGHIVWENVLDEAGKPIPDKIPFTEVTKRIGKMWHDLSDEEREDWKRRAEEANTANGLPPVEKKSPAKAAAVAKAAPKAAAAKPAAAQPVMKITRHPESKAWVIQGTNFVVQSPKNKTVIGKLRGNKAVTLTAAERKECEAKGWPVQAPAAKASAAEEEEDEE